MRNMILKTIFASILGSLFIATSAQADRQGGGTLKVAMDSSNASDPLATWVRFSSLEGNRISFDYGFLSNGAETIERVTMEKADLSVQTKTLIRALRTSKESALWTQVEI